MNRRIALLVVALTVLGLTTEGRAQQLGFTTAAQPQAVVANYNAPSDSPQVVAPANAPLAAQVSPSPCADGRCAACGTGCLESGCCLPCLQFYGEYLYLRPGDERTSYAVPVSGPVIPPPGVAPVAIGNESELEHGFGSGFRIGCSHAMDNCSSIGVEYAYYDNKISDSVNFNAPLLFSLVQQPATTSATGYYTSAAASEDMRFQLADIDYRHVFYCGDCNSLNYVVGLRYGNLTQDFRSTFTNVTTVEQVNTDIDFDGLGIKFGLEGERRACSGWMVYGKTSASFVGGVFSGTYLQSDNLRGTVVQTGWNDDRVVTILEAEVGAGWTSCSGNVRLSVGYTIQGWLNTMITHDFITAVQNGNTNSSPYLNDTLTFDGVVARAEFRF